MKVLRPFVFLFIAIIGCTSDFESDSIKRDAPLAAIGPTGCHFTINIDLESYQVISTEDGSDMNQFSTVQCALLEPTHDSFIMNGCIDEYGNGTVTMNCIPGVIGFPDLNEITPDTEPQECSITIDNNNLQIVDEDGNTLFDGPFIDNAFDPFAEAVAMALTPPQQIHELEITAVQKGGEIIPINQNLTTIRIPPFNGEPLTVLSYDPTNNIILNTIQFNEAQKIDYSIYYQYQFSNSVPTLSKVTERQRFKIEGHDTPMIRKNYYKYNTYQFEEI